MTRTGVRACFTRAVSLTQGFLCEASVPSAPREPARPWRGGSPEPRARAEPAQSRSLLAAPSALPGRSGTRLSQPRTPVCKPAAPAQAPQRPRPHPTRVSPHPDRTLGTPCRPAAQRSECRAGLSRRRQQSCSASFPWPAAGIGGDSLTPLHFAGDSGASKGVNSSGRVTPRDGQGSVSQSQRPNER